MNDNTQQVIVRACALIAEAEATLATLNKENGVDRVTLMTARTMLTDTYTCVQAINTRVRSRSARDLIKRTRRIQENEP